ncbi:hypothetical protein DFH28DRAFT_1139235 [Melampsora americana]|nr:hypothetical protein DFH28DRAFT_1139235 [Melampsora americana]
MLFPTREPFTPRTDDSLEVNWLGSTLQTGLSPRRFLNYRATLDSLEDAFAEQDRRAKRGEHIDPRINNLNITPRAARAIRRNNSTPEGQASPPTGKNLSPRVLREIQRMDQYNQSRQTKQSIRRIIKIIQDKRREEFRVLREALYQVYHYAGPYLQKPGDKAVAANLIRVGGLGAEFVGAFDNEAKWQWLQLRVNAI